MTPTPCQSTAQDAGETRLTFISDGLRLQGTLHLPSGDRPNLVVGSHGLYSSGDSPKQVALARRCCRMGVAYFRFDHRGCGKSEGCFEEITTLAGRRNDVVDAVAFLRSRFPLGNDLGLFGSSLGGATCLAAAAALQPQRVVTLAAPVDSRSILTAQDRTPPTDLDAVFFKAAFQFDLRPHLGNVKSILIVHGEYDEVIPLHHAGIIFDGVKDPKAQLVLPGGDHRLSREDHQQQFLDACLDWFKPLTVEAPCSRSK